VRRRRRRRSPASSSTAAAAAAAASSSASVTSGVRAGARARRGGGLIPASTRSHSDPTLCRASSRISVLSQGRARSKPSGSNDHDTTKPTRLDLNHGARRLASAGCVASSPWYARLLHNSVPRREDGSALSSSSRKLVTSDFSSSPACCTNCCKHPRSCSLLSGPWRARTSAATSRVRQVNTGAAAAAASAAASTARAYATAASTAVPKFPRQTLVPPYRTLYGKRPEACLSTPL